MIIIEDSKLDFHDVLIIPKRSELSSRAGVSLERKFNFKNNTSYMTIPIIAANMATGTFEMAKSFKSNNMMVAIAKHIKSRVDQWEQFTDNCFFTIGMNDEELKSAIFIYEHVPIQTRFKLCIDIANGYSQKFSDYIKKAREKMPYSIIMAGNVCTPEMTQELILSGADIVKVGIGPGSQCSTRLKTGVGYPQISAAILNADVAHGLDAYICLDGGMRSPGDVAKAFVANADFVMIGGMFAGTDECEGDVITRYFHEGEYTKDNGEYRKVFLEKKFKIFYGMSSYMSPLNKKCQKDYKTSEGSVEEVPYKGPVQGIINDLLGGLRSSGTYIGANAIKKFGKCGSFIKVSRQHDKF